LSRGVEGCGGSGVGEVMGGRERRNVVSCCWRRNILFVVVVVVVVVVVEIAEVKRLDFVLSI
jgi:hypothetical protein